MSGSPQTAVWKNIGKYTTFGMALFAMFFGSGNIVFPIFVGVNAGSQFWAAYAGLVLTAVCLPLFGLVSLSLYDGKLKAFFGRVGALPSWFLIAVIFLLAGPIGVMPRCILISFGSLQRVFPGLELFWFALGSVVVIYVLCLRPSRVIEVVGRVLTPVLLMTLLMMVFSSFWGEVQPVQVIPSKSWLDAVGFGFAQGYNTMDLFGAFVFADIAMSGARQIFPTATANMQVLIRTYMRASILGLGLLALVYLGVGMVGVRYAHLLTEERLDQLLSLTALYTMGRYGEVLVSVLVGLACLTTVISLTVSFSRFVCEEVLAAKLGYPWVLLGALCVTFVACQFDFAPVQRFISQVLELLMPALIVITVCNFLHKRFHFSMVKTPFWLTLFLTLLCKGYL
ncbi:MAG: branched-chain amino acid transport system II carrier protein [Zetaproteobacteria bacterium]|nr:branched-chain amino acid transport system II carrier protein [Zetaproteobacteria bacterium]